MSSSNFNQSFAWVSTPGRARNFFSKIVPSVGSLAWPGVNLLKFWHVEILAEIEPGGHRGCAKKNSAGSEVVNKKLSLTAFSNSQIFTCIEVVKKKSEFGCRGSIFSKFHMLRFWQKLSPGVMGGVQKKFQEDLRWSRKYWVWPPWVNVLKFLHVEILAEIEPRGHGGCAKKISGGSEVVTKNMSLAAGATTTTYSYPMAMHLRWLPLTTTPYPPRAWTTLALHDLNLKE